MNLSSQQSKKLAQNAERFVQNSESFSLLGIPGVGISVFLKNITFKSAQYIYVDIFSLPKPSEKLLFEHLYMQLGGTRQGGLYECQKILSEVTKSKKVVICFGGFDQLHLEFKKNIFKSLKALRAVNRENIVFIFGICKRIESLIPEDAIDIDLSMFANTLYIKPYPKEDLLALHEMYGPTRDINNSDLEKYLGLSGGHFQLFQLLLQAEKVTGSSTDPYIKVSLSTIYSHLSYLQKSIVKKIVSNTFNNEPDSYLIETGLITKVGDKYRTFSPLFDEFVLSQKFTKLPKKEAALLKILKTNKNKVVSKDDIFIAVWGIESTNASDWALDALIYRLRRNNAFKTKGYTIENHKKLGYRLI